MLFGIAAFIAIVVALGYAASIASRAEEKRKEDERKRKEERDREVRERAASIKRHKEEAARRDKHRANRQEEKARMDEKQRIEALGKHGAGLLKRATFYVKQIVSTEGARDGWLGDVAFGPDIQQIEDDLRRAHALRRKADELSALPSPNDDDRKMIAEVKATITQLERKSKERVELLEKCASKARLIDESLQRERDDIQVAAKREKLHGELAAMLYGVEAADATKPEPVADAVMARVHAYLTIKGQIELAREDTAAPIPTDSKARDDSWFSQAWKWIVE